MRVVEVLDRRRHDRSAFFSGEVSLDRYLQERASQHHRDGISTTHVLVEDSEPRRILGYYSLAAAQLRIQDLAPSDRRRLPQYPVPAVRMARLAVRAGSQGQGHGSYLVAHAVDRCLRMRGELGIMALVVDALNRGAADFYRGYGFRSCTDRALALYLPLHANNHN